MIHPSLAGVPDEDMFVGTAPPFKWKLGDQIGAGAHGVVYRGLNLDTGSLIAIKQISMGCMDDRTRNILQREVDILKSVRHPHVVEFYGITVRDSVLHIFTEYVSGGSIAQQLKQFGPMAEVLVQRHTVQILRGLGHLHENGIIHRDIKGQNILVSRSGLLKLADFGAARNTGSFRGSDSNNMWGTPAFVAPEIILECDHDGRADIWSLGCTIIEMLTAQLPWADKMFTSVFQLLQHVANSSEVPRCPAGVSEKLSHFLAQCLARDPRDRPSARSLLSTPFAVEAASAGGTDFGDTKETSRVKVRPNRSESDIEEVKHNQNSPAPSTEPPTSKEVDLRNETTVAEIQHWDVGGFELDGNYAGNANALRMQHVCICCYGCRQPRNRRSPRVQSVLNKHMNLVMAESEQQERQSRYARGQRAQARLRQQSSKCAVQ